MYFALVCAYLGVLLVFILARERREAEKAEKADSGDSIPPNAPHRACSQIPHRLYSQRTHSLCSTDSRIFHCPQYLQAHCQTTHCLRAHYPQSQYPQTYCLRSLPTRPLCNCPGIFASHYASAGDSCLTGAASGVGSSVAHEEQHNEEQSGAFQLFDALDGPLGQSSGAKPGGQWHDLVPRLPPKAVKLPHALDPFLTTKCRADTGSSANQLLYVSVGSCLAHDPVSAQNIFARNGSYLTILVLRQLLRQDAFVYASFAGTVGAQSIMFAKATLEMGYSAIQGRVTVWYLFLCLPPFALCLWCQVNFLNQATTTLPDLHLLSVVCLSDRR